MRWCVSSCVALSLLSVISSAIDAAVWDPTFGNQGVTLFHRPGEFISSRALLRLPDGRFAVGGSTEVLGNPSNGFLAVLKADGTPDTNFGNGGTLIIPGISGIYSLGIDSSGLLLAGGTTPLATTNEMGIARILPNGALDTSFGTAGLATANFGERSDIPRRLLVQNDGKIIAVGTAIPAVSTPDDEGDIGIARFTASGQLDWKRQEFFALPYAISSESASDLLVQSDGKILIAGGEYGSTVGGTGGSASSAFVLLRYNSDGSPDSAFGSGGRVETSASPFPNGATDSANKVMLLQDGKILAVGGSGTSLMLAEYDANGTLVDSFGSHGLALVANRGMPHPQVTILSDGTIRVVGINGNVLEAILDSAGALLQSHSYSISPRPIGANLPFLIGDNLLLDDGDLLVSGSITPDLTADLLVGQIDSPFSQVPEPSALLPVIAAVWAVSSRFGFRRPRRHSAGTPVILMTGFGYDPNHSIVRASHEGLQAVLFKPFKVNQFLAEVRKALQPQAVR